MIHINKFLRITVAGFLSFFAICQASMATCPALQFVPSPLPSCPGTTYDVLVAGSPCQTDGWDCCVYTVKNVHCVYQSGDITHDDIIGQIEFYSYTLTYHACSGTQCLAW
jgi:hypothetical protein